MNNWIAFGIFYCTIVVVTMYVDLMLCIVLGVNWRCKGSLWTAILFPVTLPMMLWGLSHRGRYITTLVALRGLPKTIEDDNHA